MEEDRWFGQTSDEFAQTLRAGYRSMIVEADEWRPLAAHIFALVSRTLITSRRGCPKCEADEILRRLAKDEGPGGW